MKIVKRLLKWLGIFFLLLIGLALLIPYLYKNEIIDLIKETANESLTAKLDFNTVELSFISTFPDLTAEITGLTITGEETFKDIVLTEIVSTSIHVDLSSILFGEQYKIKSITIDQPTFHVKVNKDGSANYDIVKVDTNYIENDNTVENTPISLALELIEIKNGSIVYQDNYYMTEFMLSDFNHSSSIVFEGDSYFMKTVTDINSISLVYDGIKYLNNINSTLDCNIDLTMTDQVMKINFKQNKAMLSLLGLSFDGWFEMLEDQYNMDLSFSTNNPELKDLLSLIPGALTEDFNTLSSNGDIKLNGKVKGTYDTSSIPGFELNLNVANGWFKYPELNGKIADINIHSSVQRSEGTDLDNLKISISDFHASLGHNSIDVKLNIETPISDPKINASFNSNINLEELKNYIPIYEDEKLNGLIFSDLRCKGSLSDIEKENYTDFNTSGSLKIMNLNYSNSNYNSSIDSMLFMFSNQALILPFFEAKFSQSDVSAHGRIDNAVEYYFNDKPLSGTFNVSSKKFNANELITTENIDSSELRNSKTPTDTITISADQYELVEIPQNISFELLCAFEEIKFNDVDLKNTKCKIYLKDGKAVIKSLKSNTLDGQIKADGYYFMNETKKAVINMNFSLENISIEDMSNQLNTIEKIAPITKFCKGKINTTFSLSTELNNQWSPVLSTINSAGNLIAKKLTIINYPVLNKIGEELNINEFNQQQMKNININFLIKDGLINVDTFDVNLIGDIKGKIVGETDLNNELNYRFLTSIPGSLFAKNESISRFNSKINNLNPVPLIMEIKGDFKNPSIVINLKNQMKETVKGVTEQVKKEVKEVISNEAQKIIEKAQKEADKIVAIAKDNANKIRQEGLELSNKTKEETKKAAVKSKTKAHQLADNEVANSKNILERKAKQIVADKAKFKASEIETKAIKEGIKKANLIVEKSENKATNIEKEASEKASKIMLEAEGKANQLK